MIFIDELLTIFDKLTGFFVEITFFKIPHQIRMFSPARVSFFLEESRWQHKLKKKKKKPTTDCSRWDDGSYLIIHCDKQAFVEDLSGVTYTESECSLVGCEIKSYFAEEKKEIKCLLKTNIEQYTGLMIKLEFAALIYHFHPTLLPSRVKMRSFDSKFYETWVKALRIIRHCV